MKAQANGVLNLSTLDGWWDEAWELGIRHGSEIGWAIGKGETYSDPARQDEVEAEALYDLMEGEIVPAFYERRADGLPRKWIARMKSSIALLCPEFNMHRMVKQYTNDYYLVAHDRYSKLKDGGASEAKHMAAWLRRVEEAWPCLRVESVEDSVPEMDLGDRVQLSARIFLNGLSPDDVVVESVLGRVSASGEIGEFTTTRMQPCGPGENERYGFQCSLEPKGQSGLYGYAVRVLPKHPQSLSRFLPGLIAWAANGLTVHDRVAVAAACGGRSES